MSRIALRVEAPIVAFRNPHAREFAETYRVPPPSTVYGMLLSLVGEEHRARHRGVRLALAMLGEPAVSVVLRTVWRVKDVNTGLGVGENRRMDFQELLTDVRFAVWVDSSAEIEAGSTLVVRLQQALTEPAKVERFGGLSLGESRDLVDVVEVLRPRAGESARRVLPDRTGNATLPLWPDHVAGARTVWGRFRVEEERPLTEEADRSAFVTIAPA